MNEEQLCLWQRVNSPRQELMHVRTMPLLIGGRGYT